MPARRLLWEAAQHIATLRGGECLSDPRTEPHSRFRWKCKKGHVWRASVRNTKRWCRICETSSRRRREPRVETNACPVHGGECLSDPRTESLWGCKKGRGWRAITKRWCKNSSRRRSAPRANATSPVREGAKSLAYDADSRFEYRSRAGAGTRAARTGTHENGDVPAPPSRACAAPPTKKRKLSPPRATSELRMPSARKTGPRTTACRRAKPSRWTALAVMVFAATVGVLIAVSGYWGTTDGN